MASTFSAMRASNGVAEASQVVSLLARPSSAASISQCAFAGGLRLPRQFGRPLTSRCSAGKDDGPLETVQKNSPSLTGIQEAVDAKTKIDITKSDILKNQAETTSEKQSILGTKPASTAPWPRPEVERRPETGDKSFTAIFAIDGAGPETINGRMAMVGFVWALVAEKLTGLTVLEQLTNPTTSGALYFGGVVILFTIASVIPFLNGESTDARKNGPFTAQAERWNGRLAMIGFAGLVINELIRQAPLIH